MQPMAPRQRLMAALRGESVDRPPAATIVSAATYELMDIAGAHLPQVNEEPEAMAALAAATHEVMGYDTVMPVFSVSQEATALGCEVDWERGQRLPVPISHPWADRSAEIRLPAGFPGSFLEERHVRCVLEAIRLLRRRFGERVAIIGKVMGPWTLSYHLYGVQEFLLDTLLDPERVRRSLETLAPVPLLFARAQIEAGADAICWPDHATGDLVRASMYRDFLLPIHKRLVPQVPAPVILHCCGPTADRIRYFREAGFACFHFESQVPPEVAVAEAAGRMRLAGNVNNPQTLLRGTPEDVRAEARRAIAAGVDIIAPECAVPLETPLANMRAIPEACAVNA